MGSSNNHLTWLKHRESDAGSYSPLQATDQSQPESAWWPLEDVIFCSILSEQKQQFWRLKINPTRPSKMDSRKIMSVSNVGKPRSLIAKHICMLIKKNPHSPHTNRFDQKPRVTQGVSDGGLGVPKPWLNRVEPDTMFFMLKHNLKCIWKVCCHRNHCAEMSRRSEEQGGERRLMKGGKYWISLQMRCCWIHKILASC